MSVATLAPPTDVPLGELVDGVALRTGAWVVVERFGTVIAHGTGSAQCPAPLVQTLLAKSTTPLRAAVTWQRGAGPLTGAVDEMVVRAVDLGAGQTAWFVGGPVEEAAIPLLAAATGERAAAVTDRLVDELLHPRGPARSGRAPQTRLVALRSRTCPPAELSHAALAAVGGTSARVHTEPTAVLVVLAPGADAQEVVTAVAARCPDVVAGVGDVRDGATDWAAAAGLALSCALAGERTGRTLADPTEPAVAAELLVDEAREASATLVESAGINPLARLQAHDERTSGELVRTLATWCRAGFDTAAAAGALHVHVNTLRYRLRRAAEISGLELDRPSHLLALQLQLAV